MENRRVHHTDQKLQAVAPPLCVALVALICGGIVAQNAPLLRAAASGSSAVPALVAAVTTMHAGGFALGYAAARFFGLPSRVCRTVSIETGMQNSALGTVLAMRSIGGGAGGAGAAAGAASAAALPGAISATVHSCVGSGLAAMWRFSDASKRSASAVTESEVGTVTALGRVFSGNMRKVRIYL